MSNCYCDSRVLAIRQGIDLIASAGLRIESAVVAPRELAVAIDVTINMPYDR